MRQAFVNGDCHQPTREFSRWLDVLREDVIEDEFGYEPGEFTVYSTHWSPLYEEGVTPREAWQRALDGHANAREDADKERRETYARIVSEDEAAIARQRAGQNR